MPRATAYLCTSQSAAAYLCNARRRLGHMAERRVEVGGSERPEAGRSEAAPAGLLGVATGLFSLIIGLLLRGSISRQDRTDWNGVVRTFLEVFPLLLIVGGTLLLILAIVRIGRRPGATRGGVDGSAPSGAQRGVAAPKNTIGRGPVDEPRPRPGRAADGPAASGRAYAAQQREALARLKAERQRRDG